MDSASLIVISTIVQTVVITITLIVFILQFKSQERSIKEASYQGLMGRYNDLVATLVDKPELAISLFSGIAGDAAKNLTKEDASVYSHLLLTYGIIEEAYQLHSKKWMSDEDWQQWSAFLEGLAGHPMFLTIHRMAAGTFDKGFEAYISKNILPNQDGPNK